MVETASYQKTRGVGRAVFLAQFATRVARIVRSLDPADHVLLLGYPPIGLLALLRLVRVKVPIVADVRDIWFDDRRAFNSTPARLAVRLGATLARRELRSADAVTYLSDDIGEWAHDKSPLSIPIGVPSFPAGPPLRSEALRCLFVGSLNRHFDLIELVDAWPSDAGSPTLDIYGSGPLESDLESLTAARPNTRFMGRVASSEVGDLLKGYDIGLAPTTVGFGTVLSNKVCEYLGSGLYVLHSLETTPSAAIESGGFGLRFDRSADGITDSLKDLMGRANDIRWERPARRARAISELGRDRSADQMLEVLSHVTSRRDKRRQHK